MPLEEGDTFFFAPRPLRNLVLVDELESLSPILHTQIADLANEDTPQIYAACGRGPRSSLRVLRHGLEVGNISCRVNPALLHWPAGERDGGVRAARQPQRGVDGEEAE